MAERITAAVLAEKIDNLTEAFNELKPEIRANTEFRLQAKGALALIGIAAGAVSSIAIWIIGKIWSNR